MPEVVQHESRSYLLYPKHHVGVNFSPEVLNPLMETLYVLTVSDLVEAYEDIHGAGSWTLLDEAKKGFLIEAATEAMSNTDHNWYEAFTELVRAQTTAIFVAKLLPDDSLEGRLIEPAEGGSVGAWLWHTYHENRDDVADMEGFLKLVLQGVSDQGWASLIDENEAAVEGAKWAYVFDPAEPSTMYWYQYTGEIEGWYQYTGEIEGYGHQWVELQAIDLGGVQPDWNAIEHQEDEEDG